MSNENEVTVDIFTVFQNTTESSSSFTIKDSFNYAPSLYLRNNYVQLPYVKKNDDGVISCWEDMSFHNKTTAIHISNDRMIYEYCLEYMSYELHDKFDKFVSPHVIIRDEYASSRGWLKTRKFIQYQIINSYMKTLFPQDTA